jgi:hypothetical protein
MLKGSSLHSHLAAKGMNDYKIIAVFAAISLISAAAAVFYAYYSTKIII